MFQRVEVPPRQGSSRPDTIKDASSNVLASYKYNGLARLVVEDFEQPDVKLMYNTGDAGTYGGFDRFGRVVDQRWYDYGVPEDRDRFSYAYDYNSNRTSKDLSLTTGKDEKYTYDGLDRLTSYDRGTLSGGDITSKVRNEAWGLSAVGAWNAFQIDHDGDGTYTDADDLDQDRTHNGVNEISGITEQTNPQQSPWADPAYDARGNMTTVPKPSDLTSTYACKYDAWNRLAEVKSGEIVVARYEYDGLNRRVKAHIDAQSPAEPNGVDHYRHFYYNASWQILETRKSTSENTGPETLQPEYQYVWSVRYMDAPVLRDKNTDSDDLCDDERLYYANDANMNVTALVGDDGTVLERYVYDPYGKVTIYDDDWSETRNTSSYDNSILFCGYYRDNETGLYHVRNRYYEPYFGWITRDPAGYVDGMSLYEYCRSGPLVFIDPFGLREGGPAWWTGPIWVLDAMVYETTYKMAMGYYFVSREHQQIGDARARALKDFVESKGRVGGESFGNRDPLHQDYGRVKEGVANVIESIPGTSLTGDPSPPTNAAELAAEAVPAALEAADLIYREWKRSKEERDGPSDVQRGGKTAQEQRSRQREQELKARIRREEEQKRQQEEQRRREVDREIQERIKREGAREEGAPPDSGDPYWDCKKHGVITEPDPANTEKICPPSSEGGKPI